MKWQMAGCLVGVLWSLQSFEQGFAAKPDLRVGDRWEFRETGSVSGKDVDRRWSREIVEITSDGMMRVKEANGNIVTFDSSWNPRNRQRPVFYPRDFEFPLSVGARWSFASPPAAYYQNGGHEVVAYESITVPAGTFDCFRLEGRSIFNSKGHSETWYMTRWYCPAIKYLAKLHVELIIWNAYALGSHAVLDSELIRFTEGK